MTTPKQTETPRTDELCEFCEIDGFGNHAPRCPVQLERELAAAEKRAKIAEDRVDKLAALVGTRPVYGPAIRALPEEGK